MDGANSNNLAGKRAWLRRSLIWQGFIIFCLGGVVGSWIIYDKVWKRPLPTQKEESLETASEHTTADLNEEFWAAARKGDEALVKELLAKGIDVNVKTEYGATASSYAADKGHLPIAKLLLENKAA